MLFSIIMKSKFVMLITNGVKTRIPPAGDGTPSKKLSLQDGSWFELILNLANLKATQITYIKHINQPNLPSELKVKK